MNLDELPRRDGFRQRGRDMTRIETLTDAAFAFALTMLVISVSQVPASYGEMVRLMRDVPAFVCAAAIMFMFWYAHHTWSRRFGLDDVPTVLLSFALVLTTLVYVFPLRFMTTTFMWFVSGGRLASDAPHVNPADVNGMCLTYAIGFTVMCACIVLLNAHAWRRREALELDGRERFDTLCEIAAWCIVGSTGIAAIAIALLPVPLWPAAPAWSFMVLPIVMPIFGRVTARRRAARFGEQSASR